MESVLGMIEEIRQAKIIRENRLAEKRRDQEAYEKS